MTGVNCAFAFGLRTSLAISVQTLGHNEPSISAISPDSTAGRVGGAGLRARSVGPAGSRNDISPVGSRPEEGAGGHLGGVPKRRWPTQRFNSSAEGKSTGQTLQLGDNDPMLLPDPAHGGPGQTLRKVDPQKRVGVETVSVPAGAFAGSGHYRDIGPAGEKIEYWTSKDALPLGLLRVTSTSSNPPSTVAMELVRQGSGAKRAIQKPPLSFDQRVMMKQVQAATAPVSPVTPSTGSTVK
jgi:hypothetical protein